MEIVDVLRFWNVCLAAVVAGGMIVVAVAIIPARSRLPVASAVTLHQLTTRRIDAFMPPFAVLSGVTAALLIALAGDVSGASRAALVTGLAATGVVCAVSAGLNMPANRQIAAWSPAAPPPEHPAVFHRWNGVHRVRTVVAVVALAAYVVATLAV